MTKENRIYMIRPRIVEVGQPIPERLVRANGKAQARGHIARAFNVSVATQDDLVSALKRSVTIEDATDAPDADTTDNPGEHP
jgi:hypothetical protein